MALIIDVNTIAFHKIELAIRHGFDVPGTIVNEKDKIVYTSEDESAFVMPGEPIQEVRRTGTILTAITADNIYLFNGASMAKVSRDGAASIRFTKQKLDPANTVCKFIITSSATFGLLHMKCYEKLKQYRPEINFSLQPIIPPTRAFPCSLCTRVASVDDIISTRLYTMAHTVMPKEPADAADEKDPCVKMTCNHQFHQSCITKWYKENKTCPLCRRRISNYVLPGDMMGIDCTICLTKMYAAIAPLQKMADEGDYDLVRLE